MSAPSKNFDQLNRGFQQWLQDHTEGTFTSDTWADNWQALSPGKRQELWDRYNSEGAPDQRPSPFAEGTGVGYSSKKVKKTNNWPDNVSSTMRSWLTKQGVTPDQWNSKGESFRSDLRAKYHKSAAAEGTFHFSSSDRAVLSNAGKSNNDIAQEEQIINGLSDPEARKAEYRNYLQSAQTKAATDAGRLGQADIDSSGKPIRVLQQHNQLKGEILGEDPQKDYGPTYSRPITAVINDPFAWNPDQVKALQSKLVDIGVLEPGAFISGKYDAATIDAYRTMVEGAVKSNMTPADYMRQLPSGAMSSKPKEPFVAPAEQRMAPEDIARVANQASQEVLGRDLTPQEMARVTAQVRSSEDAQYSQSVAQAKADYSNNPSGGGQQVPNAPDVSSIVQTDYGQTTEGKGYRVAQLGLKLLDFMNSGAGAK